MKGGLYVGCRCQIFDNVNLEMRVLLFEFDLMVENVSVDQILDSVSNVRLKNGAMSGVRKNPFMGPININTNLRLNVSVFLLLALPLPSLFKDLA